MKAFFFVLLTIVSSTLYSQDRTRIANYLDSTYRESPFFANIIIKEGEDVLVQRSFGFSDQLNKTRLTPEHSFQVASISKQFTAYAIMILRHKGVLHYDSLVKKYLPAFPYDGITIRHLLTHSSGLPNFWNDIRPHLDHTRSNGNQDVLRYLNRHSLPLQFKPGTAYQYCDIGYDFLANIIEDVSGQQYTEFLSTHVFAPLGMKNSFAYQVTDIRRIDNRDLAIGHTFDKISGKINYAHLDPENDFVFYLGDFYGDGSVVTTAQDLARWDNALHNCSLLPCDVQNESFVPFSENGQRFQANDEKKIDYGFGWKIKENERHGKIVSHWGGHPGNQHFIYRMVDRKVTFIYLSNFETELNARIVNRIVSLLEK